MDSPNLMSAMCSRLERGEQFVHICAPHSRVAHIALTKLGVQHFVAGGGRFAISATTFKTRQILTKHTRTRPKNLTIFQFWSIIYMFCAPSKKRDTRTPLDAAQGVENRNSTRAKKRLNSRRKFENRMVVRSCARMFC